MSKIVENRVGYCHLKLIFIELHSPNESADIQNYERWKSLKATRRKEEKGWVTKLLLIEKSIYWCLPSETWEKRVEL